jgi:predicted dehydrogenase
MMKFRKATSFSDVSRRTFLQTAAAASLTLAVPDEAKPARKIAADTLIRVGLIGLEGHPGEILNSLPKLPKIELTAYARSRPQEEAGWLQDHPAFHKQTRIYADYHAMLEKEDLQIVGVFMPYYQNAQVSIEAARRGIHILSEKPAATTLDDLDQLDSVIRSSGIRYSILLAMRAMPVFQAARTAIQQGLVGEPLLLSSQKSYKFGQDRPWFYRERRTYGGTIPWVGIHSIDYMRWVSGQEYSRVSASHGNKAHPTVPGCEDYAGLLFNLANGGTAVAHLDFLRPESAPTHGDDRLRIAGSEGVLEVLDNEERVSLLNSKGRAGNLPLPPPIDFFANFISELRGEGTHLVSNQEALWITRVCLKAREAADQGGWISLDEMGKKSH